LSKFGHTEKLALLCIETMWPSFSPNLDSFTSNEAGGENGAHHTTVVVVPHNFLTADHLQFASPLGSCYLKQSPRGDLARGTHRIRTADRTKVSSFSMERQSVAW